MDVAVDVVANNNKATPTTPAPATSGSSSSDGSGGGGGGGGRDSDGGHDGAPATVGQLHEGDRPVGRSDDDDIGAYRNKTPADPLNEGNGVGLPLPPCADSAATVEGQVGAWPAADADGQSTVEAATPRLSASPYPLEETDEAAVLAGSGLIPAIDHLVADAEGGGGSSEPPPSVTNGNGVGKRSHKRKSTTPAKLAAPRKAVKREEPDAPASAIDEVAPKLKRGTRSRKATVTVGTLAAANSANDIVTPTTPTDSPTRKLRQPVKLEDGGEDMAAGVPSELQAARQESKPSNHAPSSSPEQSVMTEWKSKNPKICCICVEDDDPDDPLTTCANPSCAVVVHRDCYGLPPLASIASAKGARRRKGGISAADSGSSSWLCDRCMLPDPELAQCMLCPIPFGAVRRLSMKEPCYTHIVCALWNRGLEFRDEARLSDIAWLSPDLRHWDLQCSLCTDESAASFGCKRMCDAHGCKKALRTEFRAPGRRERR
ncbi:hypothetical protein DFJ73DRAFT_499969 [Zopfochytrium polystomum]|nr:hypothetical protein DFJ73DRAFT_499969 [Zopfochytrium polystomum]